MMINKIPYYRVFSIVEFLGNFDFIFYLIDLKLLNVLLDYPKIYQD